MMTQTEEKTKSALISAAGSVLEGLSRVEGVKSLTLIGDDPARRRVENVTDLDLVLVMDKVTVERYRQLQRVVENARNLSDRSAEVRYAFRSGIYNEQSEREASLFFHTLLYEGTPVGLAGPILGDVSWAQERPYQGMPLSEIMRIPLEVTWEMLMKRSDGIEYLIDLCSTNSTMHSTWQETPEGMKKTRVRVERNEPRERMELYAYSILRCASNTLRYVTGNVRWGIDRSMCAAFGSRFPEFRYNSLPMRAYADKRLLRNEMLALNESFVQGYQLKTVDFLVQLRDVLYQTNRGNGLAEEKSWAH